MKVAACTKLYIIIMHTLTRLRYSCGTGGCGRGTGCGSSRNVRIGVHRTGIDQWVHDESLSVLSMGACMQCVFTREWCSLSSPSLSPRIFFSFFDPVLNQRGIRTASSLSAREKIKHSRYVCFGKTSMLVCLVYLMCPAL